MEDARLQRIEDDIRGLGRKFDDRFDKLSTRVEQVARHGDRNIQEGDLAERNERMIQHGENQKRLDSQDKKLWAIIMLLVASLGGIITELAVKH